MILDHVLPGPITGIPRAFTHPKEKPAPRHDTAVSLARRERTCNACTQTDPHTHLFIWDSLIHLFLFKIENAKKGRLKTSSVSRTQGDEMTPRSEIPQRQSGMTLTFRYASGLFSQVEFETDRQTDGRRKVKQK